MARMAGIGSAEFKPAPTSNSSGAVAHTIKLIAPEINF